MVDFWLLVPVDILHGGESQAAGIWDSWLHCIPSWLHRIPSWLHCIPSGYTVSPVGYTVSPVGYTISPVGKQKKNAYAPFSFFFLFIQSRATGHGIMSFTMDFPSLVKHFWKQLQRYTQKCVSMVNLTHIRMAVNISITVASSSPCLPHLSDDVWPWPKDQATHSSKKRCHFSKSE